MTWSKWKSFQIKLHHAKRILILEITSGYLEPFHKLSYLTYNLINIYHSDPKEKKKKHKKPLWENISVIWTEW